MEQCQPHVATYRRSQSFKATKAHRKEPTLWKASDLLLGQPKQEPVDVSKPDSGKQLEKGLIVKEKLWTKLQKPLKSRSFSCHTASQSTDMAANVDQWGSRIQQGSQGSLKHRSPKSSIMMIFSRRWNIAHVKCLEMGFSHAFGTIHQLCIGCFALISWADLFVLFLHSDFLVLQVAV